ncbi:hypothetical protein D9M72_616070 [compost metagenome]
MARLTPSPKQLETLEHISPTVAELAKLAGIHCNAVQDRINALDRKGLITRTAGTGRTIRPVS